MTTEHDQISDMEISKPRDLYGLFVNLRRYHSGRRANQERWDAKYYQDVAWARAHVPGDIKIFQSSLATDIVDQTADDIRTDEPVITFTPDKDNESSRKHASRMEKWATEEMERDRKNAEVDPYGQASMDTALRGEGVIKQLHNPNRPHEPVRSEFSSQEDFEEAHQVWEAEMQNYSPLLPARFIDPLNIYLPPNARAPYPYIVEHQKRTQIDMWRDYPDWKGQLGKIPGMDRQLRRSEIEDPAREVDWLEYWDANWYIIEVDGVRVRDRVNPYGVVPYWHSYSGLGRVDRDAGSDRKAIGILGKIEGEVEGDVMLRTITFAAATQYVFPRIKAPEDRVTEVRDAMAQRSVIPYDRELGPNSVQWLESPELKPDVSIALGQIQNAIAHRVTPSQSGIPTNAQSGVQEALRIGQSSKSTTKIVEAVNNLASGVLNLKVQILKATGLEATLEDGKMLKGDDFDKANFHVKFNAFDPIEDTRQQQNGLTLLRDRAITKRTYREQYISRIVEDPDEEEIEEGFEAAWDAWLASPEFQQWAVRQHMGDEAIAMQDQANTAQAAGQPGTSDAGREADLALLEQLAPTTPLNEPLAGAEQLAGGLGAQI